MADEWVEVYRAIRSPGLQEGITRLTEAGIPVRVVRSNARFHHAPGTSAPDELWVPKDAADDAATVLAAWDVESEAKIGRHMGDLALDTAVAVCLVSLAAGGICLGKGNTTAAIGCGITFLLALPFAWMRFRRRRRSQAANPAKPKRTWF